MYEDLEPTVNRADDNTANVTIKPQIANFGWVSKWINGWKFFEEWNSFLSDYTNAEKANWLYLLVIMN